MKHKVSLLTFSICIALMSTISLFSQGRSDVSTDSPSLSADRIIDKAVEQERALTKRMTTLTPIIETYTQNMELNADLGAVPKSDKYFLGKLDLRRGNSQNSFHGNTLRTHPCHRNSMIWPLHDCGTVRYT